MDVKRVVGMPVQWGKENRAIFKQHTRGSEQVNE